MQVEAPKQITAIEALNERFNCQNKRLEELIVRLNLRLNALSETSLPPNIKDSVKQEQTSFNEGSLMNYHCGLNAMDTALNYLCDSVNKIEGLI